MDTYDFKNYLNKSCSILEYFIDDELPAFYRECTNKASYLADLYNIRFDEYIVYETLNEVFRVLEDRILNEYHDLIDPYKGKIDDTENKMNLLNELSEKLNTELKPIFTKNFERCFDDFEYEFKSRVQGNTDNEIMFKNELIRAINEKMQYAIDDLYIQFKGKTTLGLEDYMDEFKKEEKEEEIDLNSHPLIQEIADMGQYIDRSSDGFKNAYNQYIDLAAKVIHSGIDLNKVDERVINLLISYKNQMKSEVELLKQGYTSNDYQENFDGTFTLNEESKTL